jgi:hypothetical protein
MLFQGRGTTLQSRAKASATARSRKAAAVGDERMMMNVRCFQGPTGFAADMMAEVMRYDADSLATKVFRLNLRGQHLESACPLLMRGGGKGEGATGVANEKSGGIGGGESAFSKKRGTEMQRQHALPRH